MVKNIIDESFRTKSLFGCRTKLIDWGELIIGYIIEKNDIHIIINEIDEYGFPIGDTMIKIEDIQHVEIKDKYQEKLEFLYENSKQLSYNKRYTIWDNQEEFIKRLEIVKKSEKIVTLFLDDDNYLTGKILEIDESFLLIHNIGEDGESDGISCYRLCDFIGLRYDGIKELKIALLNKGF